ncbi:MAG TPA: UDP-N-acetylmuramate:L-alanyl-gamma-D-glutamyl-meso-diaminopimelate ligase [Candidatus Sulfotelmatobacter sp.]|jgi:UDP-N-acetylmuramate: L-alanyl-gamma-D-glutamyl-meso-diaminopimelate ligase|nr:UDP-N-acetylmuramate:L-alanyl-gamma-D-glutamyl-meso-diaminopimelate ligase [Candidatus Sulfotelmatobacter sp.]
MNDKKHIHLIGICGTAMASLAGMLKQRGFRVTGSDAAAYPPMSDFLAELGIPVAQPFDARNLDPTPDLVVVGNAISRGNPELEHILDQRISFCSLPQLLHDEFLRGKEVLVVAGTHGKTTTTSMLAWIFHTAGMQPSFLIGGIAENFGSSFHLGQGKHFILEGDEYDTAFFDKGPKFLHYFPDAIILTSVEFDHADIYKDLDAVETAFKRLVNLIPRRGRIIAFDGMAAEATESASLERSLSKAFCPVERYGASPNSAWRVTNLQLDSDKTTWTVLDGGRVWADLEFPLAGEYNVWNATAAAAMASAYGISKEEISAALKTFKSVKRRLEVKAEVNGITIIDDFAHHPTAIAGTLKALRARYAGSRLWAILEPRSNTLRRRVLQADLARSLAVADEIIVAGVFRSEALPENERLELPELAADIQKHGKRARLIANADEIVEKIAPEMRSGDIVAILSNGGFGGIYEKLPAKLRSLAATANTVDSASAAGNR